MCSTIIKKNNKEIHEFLEFEMSLSTATENLQHISGINIAYNVWLKCI